MSPRCYSIAGSEFSLSHTGTFHLFDQTTRLSRYCKASQLLIESARQGTRSLDTVKTLSEQCCGRVRSLVSTLCCFLPAMSTHMPNRGGPRGGKRTLPQDWLMESSRSTTDMPWRLLTRCVIPLQRSSASPSGATPQSSSLPAVHPRQAAIAVKHQHPARLQAWPPSSAAQSSLQQRQRLALRLLNSRNGNGTLSLTRRRIL